MNGKKAKMIRKQVYGDLSLKIERQYDNQKAWRKEVPLFKQVNPYLRKMKALFDKWNWNKPKLDKDGKQKIQIMIMGQLINRGPRAEYQKAKREYKGII